VSSNRSEPKQTVQLQEYLTFFIAEVEYALSLDYVREVIPYDTVTRVPGMPSTVRGVTNLRGSVVPVIDLAIKFHLPPIAVTSRTCIVLVETQVGENSLLLGLLTEEVGQVLAVDPAELLAPPAFGTPVNNEYLQHMLPVGKKFALVLDIARTLSHDELLAPEAARAPAAGGGGEPTLELEDGDAEGVDDEGWAEADTASQGSPAHE
jgi:purine-binding chemotaxis protein CheW